MAKKKKKEIEEIKGPLTPVSPLFSNVVAMFSTPYIVMLDFGLVAPSYRQPYDVEDSQIARICLEWDSAETLSEALSKAISNRKKERGAQKRAKSR
ncbi:MAG: hypothetical protein V1894_00555 [Chloroflexota bacterium]